MENIIEFEPARNSKLNWDTILIVAAFHVVALAAFFTFSWQNLVATLVLWWIGASWGVGIGYHRLLTHRGFSAPRWLVRLLATFGTLALQSGPVTWVTTHRIHHAFTETDRDPHSPRNGTWWAHIGWIFKGQAQHHTEAETLRYSPDLVKDPYLVFIDKYYYLATVMVAIGLFAIGGWTMVIWAVFVRIVVSWHFTWLVNSATHLWGSRRFETRDDSRNNGLVAAVTFGEGWHNNHHAFPRSARHGLTWKEVDLNWIQLRIMEKVGLIRDLYAYKIDDEQNEPVEMRQAA